jgi:hypothetical protein
MSGDAGIMLKQVVARTVVITALNYFLLRGSYLGSTLMDSATVGFVGAVGSVATGSLEDYVMRTTGVNV